MIAFLRDSRGFAAAPWCGRGECEARVKDESSATIRCLPLADGRSAGRACVCCGRPAITGAVWAQAY
jgi:prolyl-tRNA synthetase